MKKENEIELGLFGIPSGIGNEIADESIPIWSSSIAYLRIKLLPERPKSLEVEVIE